MSTAESSSSKALDRAEQLAEELFFPEASNVDTAERVPASHLDLLAQEGFYGLAGPAEFSPVAAADLGEACRVIEVLAGACLTTAFVWAQHHSAVIATTYTQRDHIRETWLAPLCRGERRAGLALAAAIRPGTPTIRARAVDGGYVFDGRIPWVTGWGMTDVLYAGARDAEDTIVWAMLDVTPSPSMTAEPVNMLAVQASQTVEVRLDNHFVPEDRVTGLVSLVDYQQRDAATLRFNGSFALGLTGRCTRLIGQSPLDDQLAAAREKLDTAGPDELADARATATELASRAAAALVTTVGSNSVLMSNHAQRLVREATFLLVFGSRPAIKDGLLKRFFHA